MLDTWFSSWLWPISVFDGIRNPGNREISYYYPTNDLVTGPDIIFFWVARMIMAGYEYRGEKPFGNVYFTGIVRDKIGRKMSKQLGNSPDPLDLIAKYGADGMRMAMLISSSAGNDVMFDEALCEQGRNFGNKIWNAYRLVNGWSADGKAAQDENNRLAVEWFRQTLGVALRQIADEFRLLPHFGGVQDGLQALLGRLQRPVPGDGETRLRAADRRADVRSHTHVLRLP